MSKHEIIESDRPGRRSGIRRLVYRPSNREESGGHPRKSESRDWETIKDQLRLTVRRAPEVVINVRGSRSDSDSDREAITGVLRYMMYISRGGKLPLENEQANQIQGCEAIRETHASWNLEMQRMRSGKHEPLHPTFNIIFSMPARTDPAKMRAAVADFARDHFDNHQYVMVLHTQDTDPADNPPEHPHVHLILRAEDENGRRIYIRKADLRSWREAFAARLRAHGIEANATSRAERGKVLKAVRGAEWHIQRRYDKARLEGVASELPAAKASRFRQAADELAKGDTKPKPWEIAMAARRRDVVRGLTDAVARLNQEGDKELAGEVERFLREMPPLDSERR